ncbi:hypothetical protein PE066_04400 [Ramlibacter tataouinensis]|uniref:hypothetical protein n=1 Tax=Ramlibacter tataouinensis TaxID=94132 RepID=UPI0022F3997C|nr:hypothetical protein [Ramlibacter tataouinensis]WBY02786.1 hypothetical protein PE066_04400 [Ramlibacter tataouinensis]
MKRRELYEKVWATPITRISKELGISDVALAKACRRHGIPTPPRGYWAKLQAGHKLERARLPNPDKDTEVVLAITSPEQRARAEQDRATQKRWLEEHAQPAPEPKRVSMPESLEGAHPLIRFTSRYCERIPGLERKWERRRPSEWGLAKEEDRPPHADHGRYRLFHKGCLNITCSLANIDWLLRFHAGLFGALETAGFKITRREVVGASRYREDKPAAVVATREDEVFEIEFTEGYRRVPMSPEEIAKLTRERGHAPYQTYETIPSGKYTLKWNGTEYRARAEWQGTAEKLEGRLGEIAEKMIELGSLQPLFRKEREAAEARAKREAERREAARRVAESRAEQLKRAFSMAETHEQIERLERFLRYLDEHAANLKTPFADRLKVWLGVVREELAEDSPLDKQLAEVLTVPSWQSWPPPWWPVADKPTD